MAKKRKLINKPEISSASPVNNFLNAITTIIAYPIRYPVHTIICISLILEIAKASAQSNKFLHLIEGGEQNAFDNMQTSSNNRFNRLQNTAAKAVENQDYQKAFAAIDELLTMEPTNQDLWESKINISKHFGDIQASLHAAKILYKFNPHNECALTELFQESIQLENRADINFYGEKLNSLSTLQTGAGYFNRGQYRILQSRYGDTNSTLYEDGLKDMEIGQQMEPNNEVYKDTIIQVKNIHQKILQTKIELAKAEEKTKTTKESLDYHSPNLLYLISAWVATLIALGLSWFGLKKYSQQQQQKRQQQQQLQRQAQKWQQEKNIFLTELNQNKTTSTLAQWQLNDDLLLVKFLLQNEIDVKNSEFSQAFNHLNKIAIPESYQNQLTDVIKKIFGEKNIYVKVDDSLVITLKKENFSKQKNQLINHLSELFKSFIEKSDENKLYQNFLEIKSYKDPAEENKEEKTNAGIFRAKPRCETAFQETSKKISELNTNLSEKYKIIKENITIIENEFKKITNNTAIETTQETIRDKIKIVKEDIEKIKTIKSEIATLKNKLNGLGTTEKITLKEKPPQKEKWQPPVKENIPLKQNQPLNKKEKKERQSDYLAKQEALKKQQEEIEEKAKKKQIADRKVMELQEKIQEKETKIKKLKQSKRLDAIIHYLVLNHQALIFLANPKEIALYQDCKEESELISILDEKNQKLAQYALCQGLIRITHALGQVATQFDQLNFLENYPYFVRNTIMHRPWYFFEKKNKGILLDACQEISKYLNLILDWRDEKESKPLNLPKLTSELFTGTKLTEIKNFKFNSAADLIKFIRKNFLRLQDMYQIAKYLQEKTLFKNCELLQQMIYGDFYMLGKAIKLLRKMDNVCYEKLNQLLENNKKQLMIEDVNIFIFVKYKIGHPFKDNYISNDPNLVEQYNFKPLELEQLYQAIETCDVLHDELEKIFIPNPNQFFSKEAKTKTSEIPEGKQEIRNETLLPRVSSTKT